MEKIKAKVPQRGRANPISPGSFPGREQDRAPLVLSAPPAVFYLSSTSVSFAHVLVPVFTFATLGRFGPTTKWLWCSSSLFNIPRIMFYPLFFLPLLIVLVITDGISLSSQKCIPPLYRSVFLWNLIACKAWHEVYFPWEISHLIWNAYTSSWNLKEGRPLWLCF